MDSQVESDTEVENFNQEIIKLLINLQEKIIELDKKLDQVVYKMKNKWRNDIKKELNVYTYNNLCSKGDEIEAEYSE